MLTWLRILFFCFYALVVISSVIALLMSENDPYIVISHPINKTKIKQLKTIFRKVNSSKLMIKKLQLSQMNLNNLFNYFLSRYFKIATHIKLISNQLDINISLHLPKNTVGNYLNIGFKLNFYQHKPLKIHSLHIGKLVIADEFSQLILTILPNYAPFENFYKIVNKTVKRIKITPDYLTLNYHFEADNDNSSSISLLPIDKKVLAIYQQKIIKITKAHNPAWRLSLATLLQPLFEIALQRSTLTTAINENKMLIIAVSHYVNQSEIQRYLPSNDKYYYAAFLYKRQDMAKHFMTSALLTTMGNSSLAIMIGQEKELRDAKLGHGFSFIDLAGDRAGIYFGNMAIDNPESARRLQKLMAKIKDYRDFMPEVRDLPENISDKVFKNKFGSVYSESYLLMLKKIDSRITALPIYSQK